MYNITLTLTLSLTLQCIQGIPYTFAVYWYFSAPPRTHPGVTHSSRIGGEHLDLFSSFLSFMFPPSSSSFFLFRSCSTFFLLAVLDLNFYREKGSAIPFFPSSTMKSIVWCSRAFQRCCRFHVSPARSKCVCLQNECIRGLLPPGRSNLYSSRTTKMPHGVTVVLHGIPLGYLRPLSGPVAGAAGEGVVCRKPQQQSIPAKMILCKYCLITCPPSLVPTTCHPPILGKARTLVQQRQAAEPP